MRAILIDVERRLVSEVDISSEIADIYAHLKCSTFAVAGNFNEKDNLCDSLYVDDEGYCNSGNRIFKFQPPGWEERMHFEFAGNGLIIGLDTSTGESTDARVPLFDAALWADWTSKITN